MSCSAEENEMKALIRWQTRAEASERRPNTQHQGQRLLQLNTPPPLFILPLFCSPAAPWPPLSQMRPGLIISVTGENIGELGTCHWHKASPKTSRFNFSNGVSLSSSRYLDTLVIFSNLFVCQIIFWRLSFPAQRMETNLKLERFLCQAGLKRDGP